MNNLIIDCDLIIRDEKGYHYISIPKSGSVSQLLNLTILEGGYYFRLNRFSKRLSLLKRSTKKKRSSRKVEYKEFQLFVPEDVIRVFLGLEHSYDGFYSEEGVIDFPNKLMLYNDV
jgi:hypothetical protein